MASVPQLSQFNAQNLANLVRPAWSHPAKPQLLKRGTCSSRLLLAPLSLHSTRQWQQTWSDVPCVQAWAYANLMFEPPCQLLDHVATAAQRSITKFSPQNTSNLIWCALVERTCAERKLAPGTSCTACHSCALHVTLCQQSSHMLCACAGRLHGWGMRLPTSSVLRPHTLAPTCPTISHSPSPTLYGVQYIMRRKTAHDVCTGVIPPS